MTDVGNARLSQGNAELSPIANVPQIAFTSASGHRNFDFRFLRQTQCQASHSATPVHLNYFANICTGKKANAT
jgi:hypothetical protein